MSRVRDRAEDFKESVRVAALGHGYTEVSSGARDWRGFSPPSSLEWKLSQISPERILLIHPCVDFLLTVSVSRAHVFFHHPEAAPQITLYKGCNQDGTNSVFAAMLW
jgi:hypothetical protein